MQQDGTHRAGYGRWLVYWLATAAVLCALAACGAGGSTGADSPSRSTPFPTVPLPPRALALHQQYQADGIILTVSAYDRHVDPRSVPIPHPDLTTSHFVHLVCTIHNTLPRAQVVDLRVSTTPYVTPAASVAGSADLTPAVVNGVYTIPEANAALDRLETVPAKSSVPRDVYYWIDDPPPPAMQLYLQVWNVGDHDSNDVRSTPPLFLIDVGDPAAHP